MFLPPTLASWHLVRYFLALQDMLALDKSLAQAFEALKEAVQMRDAFEGLLEIEGLPASTSTDDYITYMVSKQQQRALPPPSAVPERAPCTLIASMAFIVLALGTLR